MKKLLLILVAFVCCLSLFTQDALLIYRRNYAKPLLVALKDITNITYKDAEQVMSLEEWNITSESETTVIDSLVFVDLETLDTNEYAHFVCPDDHHPHMIDLGLPSGVLWSCCNVGASTPEGYGGYYAWGETEEKEVYNWSTYTHCDGIDDTCHDIGDDIAGTEYDVAHVKWGGSWTMPSKDQIQELIDNCTSTWITQQGINGALFTGPNGATLFLPAAGRHIKNLEDVGTDGYYWSSSCAPSEDDSQDLEDAFALNFYYYPGYYSCECEDKDRDNGRSVRPVVTPEKTKDDCPVAEAIDLGLPSGTKWASWNVGASAPEESGGYFAWGETEEKDYYDVGTYKYYNSETNEYIYIGDDIAGTEYDVAHVKWGGSWCMPSFDQMTELLDNCTRTWTQQNGVNGTLFTGPNGNSIFLPAAGGRWLDDSGSEREYGIYWSSLNQGGWGDFVYRLFFDSSSCNCSSGYCGYGQSVRPVCPSDNITFADEVVKAICVANWDTDGDGELSYEEAAAVNTVGKVFYEKQGISSFNELQYFTGLTIIEEEAFRECSLESVSIPASVKTIGEKAFMQCPNLSEVSLPEGVTWIDEEAFSACALTSIILPESLVRLGEQALEENPLISVNLPRNVAYLGNSDEDDLYDGVFDFCYSLKEVNVDESNETYASFDGVLTTKDKKILLFYPYAKGDGYEVPEGIEQIHYKAFNECKNTSVTLPSTLKSFYTDEDEESYSSFSDNFDLRTVRAKMKVPFECGYYSFSSETYSSGTLYVPQGSKTLYETTTGWSRFQNIVEEEEEGSDFPVAEAIDLGLPSGTRWASWNVGASAPEEYGGYYAWGETEEKGYYDWSTYKYCKGSNGSLTKYCTFSNYGDNGFTDGLTELLPEDDVATANWGAAWHMPTKEQLGELRDNCTIEWTLLNGVKGYLVTGPNGATIFLPAAGSYWGDVLYEEGMYGYYWSSSGGGGSGAHYLYYASSFFNCWDSTSRHGGLSVRPVMDPEIPQDAISCPDDHHPHTIDLGLPSGTKWSCCNIDASNPEEYGGYYAWGETEVKDIYDWSNYTFYDSETGLYIHIGDDIACTEYDVAHVKLGGPWRMPTIDQIYELLDNCKWKYTTLKGVNGSLITGPNGATVFLPASGYREGESLNWKGTDGCYWSSSLVLDDLYTAYCLHFGSNYQSRSETVRHNGYTVRAVCP